MMPGAYRPRGHAGLTSRCQRPGEVGDRPTDERDPGGREMSDDQSPAELARQINLMDRDEKREFLSAFVAELDSASYRQLENAMDVVI